LTERTDKWSEVLDVSKKPLATGILDQILQGVVSSRCKEDSVHSAVLKKRWLHQEEAGALQSFVL